MPPRSARITRVRHIADSVSIREERDHTKGQSQETSVGHNLPVGPPGWARCIVRAIPYRRSPRSQSHSIGS